MVFDPASLMWMASSKAINSIRLAAEISQIHSRIIDVYTDISEGHIQSAIQALNAIKGCNNPEFELRSVISHLRDAYNINANAVVKKRKLNYILFSMDEDVLDNACKSILYESCIPVQLH